MSNEEAPPETPVSKKLSDREVERFTAEAKSGFLWIFGTTALWQAVSWICTLITVRILLPEDYGIVAMPDAIFPYLTMLVTFKLDTWILQTDYHSEKDERTLLSMLLLFGVLCTIAGLCAAPFLANLYRLPELETVAQMMCIIFIPRALRVIPESRLRRDLQFKPIAVANLVIGVTRGLLQVLMAYLGYRYWTLVFGTLFFELALFLWMSLAAGFPRGFGWDRKVVRDAFNFGASATGSTLFWVMFSTADNFVVGYLFGKEMLGYYSTAFLLTDLPLSKINTVLAPVITPFYSKLRHNPSELFKIFLKTNKILVSVVAPCLVGLGVVAPIFVPLCFGDHWGPMVLPLQVMCLVGILRALTANVSAVLFAVGEPNRVLWLSGITAVILPLGFYTLGAQFGMDGIYATWLLFYPILGPLLFFNTVSKLSGIPLKEFFSNFYPTFVSVVLMALVTYGLGQTLRGQVSDLLVISAQIVLGALTYGISYRMLFPQQFSEQLGLVRGFRP